MVQRAIGFVGLVAVSCGEPTLSGGPVTDVQVTAAEVAGLPGSTVQLTAVARNEDGLPVPSAQFAWGSSRVERGTVDAQGLVTFHAEPGDFLVTAMESTSSLADTIPLRSAVEGEIRWAVELGMPLFTSGGPTLGLDGSVWVPARAWESGEPIVGELYHLSARGDVLCQVTLPEVYQTFPVALPSGDGVWIVGRTVYRVSDTCQVLGSVATDAMFSLFLSAAVGDDGTLYATSGFHLFAFRPDLTERWRSPRSPNGGWLQPPTVTANRVYAKISSGDLYALDRTTGQTIWSVPDPDSPTGPTFGHGPAVTADRVYLPNRFSFVAYDTSGAQLWQSPPEGTGVSEPVVTSAGLVISQFQLAMVARDLSGNEVWRQPSGRSRWWNWIGGPALVEGGRVYAAAADGFYAFDAATGAEVWKADAVPGDSTWFAGSPAIGSDGTAYTWAGTHVYAIFGSRPTDASSPWPMWRRDAQRTGRVP